MAGAGKKLSHYRDQQISLDKHQKHLVCKGKFQKILSELSRLGRCLLNVSTLLTILVSR